MYSTAKFVATLSLFLALGAFADSPLTMDMEAAGMVAGTFESGGSTAFFSARTMGLSKTEFSVQVNSVVIDATLDNTMGVLTIDGQGNHILPTERSVLVALTSAMEGRLSSRVVRPHEEMLMNIINYLSEAPAGYAFNKMVINRAEGEFIRLDASSTGTKACYQSDNDSAKLSGGCSYRSYSSQHDANGGGHCFATFSVSGGCRISASCPGRCGVGCGSSSNRGKGKYYMDCLDHDNCCGTHGGCTNPLDTECGDEYGEAAWEFTFGSTNCTAGC